jgi:hypothetical protein
VVVSEFPAVEAALLGAARRRYGRRRRRPRAAGAVIAAAAAGVVLLVARPAAPDLEVPADARWTTTSVPRYGLSVSLPAGWRLARQSLTPHLYDPREIMTATTFPAVPVPRACTVFPAVALGPGDALVSVQERSRPYRFALRPRRFAPAPVGPIAGRMVNACVGGAGEVSYQDFSDGLRSFHALVALDARASARVRDQAYAILDRLRFDPRFVPWWRAPR